MNDKKHSTIKRIMAKRCDWCIPCRFARANPDSKIGKAIAWHGSWCPFWQAWQEVYGEESSGPAGSTSGG